MSLNVKTNRTTYYFDGPHQDFTPIRRLSGVYVITTVNAVGMHDVIDAGESGSLLDRLASHDRRDTWPRHRLNGLYVSILYCGEAERMAVEADIRGHFNPPCGDR